MNFFKNPSWISNELLNYNRLEDIPETVFNEINERLRTLLSTDPFVSIVIPAKNEEVNLIRTLDSLSKNKTSYKVEIIVVNNNSTDRTQQVLDKLNVVSLFQPKAGCGPARQMGQEHAKGKYILMADADCFYPPKWVENMTKALLESGVACIYGRYSFLGTPEQPRWKYSLYEAARNVIVEARHLKRPCINALGMSMGYVKDMGLKVGFVPKQIRGEDGRLCFQLREMGKIKQVRDRSVIVWTLPRTLQKEGSLLSAFTRRALLELSRVQHYFYPQAPHDVTKTKNYDPTIVKYFRKRIQKQHSEPEQG